MASYDLLIIGAGPAAWSCAMTARQRGLTTAVACAQSATSWLQRAERIDNYPGLPQISGKELLSRFRAQAADMGVVIIEQLARQIRRHPPVNGDERAFGFQPRQQRVRRYGRAEDEDAVVAVFARVRLEHQLICFVPDGLRLALAQAVRRIFRLRVLRQQVVIHLGCQSGEKFRFFDAARPC